MLIDPTLAAATAAQEALREAEIARYAAVLEWIGAHEVTGPDAGPDGMPDGELIGSSVFSASGRAVRAGGPGCPFVGEFDLYGLGAALGVASSTITTQVAHYGEIVGRLPCLHQRVLSGEVGLWRACRIAEATIGLPWQAARWVDSQVAFCAERCSWSQLARSVESARAEFDPVAAGAEAARAADQRRVEVWLARPGHEASGVAEVHGLLDYADALALDIALDDGAARLAHLTTGEAEEPSHEVLRSIALGDLARGQATLDLAPDSTAGIPPTRPGPRARRELTIVAHLDDTDVARLDHAAGRLALVDQIAAWCGAATAVTIRPVVDLRRRLRAEGYAVPDRIREHLQLAHPTCVFPQCRHRADACDLDHITAWPHGPTSTVNLAPLCRRHHRLKTHGGWTYLRVVDDPDHPLVEPGPPRWVWTNPTGAVYETCA